MIKAFLAQMSMSLAHSGFIHDATVTVDLSMPKGLRVAIVGPFHSPLCSSSKGMTNCHSGLAKKNQIAFITNGNKEA